MKIQREPHLLLLTVVAAAVILVSWAGAFVGLEASSLWLDELFSAYFSDVTLPTAGDLLRRAAEDVNPPGYYFVLWASVRGTGLDFTLASRGVSALLGCFAIALIALAPTRSVSLAPRLVAGAFAATSAIWFHYTQEARAYTLAFVFLAGMTACALRSLEKLRNGHLPVGALASLAVLSVAACLSHYYTILFAGGLYAMLLLHVRSLKAFVAVSAAGLSVLACVVAFVSWHVPQMVVDISDTWFSATPGALKYLTIAGVIKLVSPLWSFVFLGLLVLLVLWGGLAKGPRGTWAVLAHDHLGASLTYLVGACILAYLFGIAVTVAFTPMLSFRFFNLLAPVFWVGLAYSTQLLLALMDGPARGRAAAATLAFALLATSSQVLERGRDTKQPWRQSAEAVAALDGCEGATLPVAWLEQRYFREDDPERFYGFYLPADPERAWLPLDRHDLIAELSSADMGALVRSTADGRRACPLLLWSLHMGGPVKSEAIASALAAHLGEEPAADITLKTVRPRDGGPAARLFLLESATDGLWCTNCRSRQIGHKGP